MIGHHPYRLAYDKATYGVLPINCDETDDPADQIIQLTNGHGVDA
ncbi:MAG: alcohol dehydrogenase [Bradyrhizobium sp.]|nr:alcohol dehydrogenase [Bradyrhizobium sp.]